LTPRPGKLSAEAPPSASTLAVLGAFCLFLSTIEYLIPKPLPFMRLGLANLPLMLALDIFPLRSFCLLVLIKVLGQALVTGTLFSYVFLFSLAGSAVSAAAMYSLRRLLGPKRVSLAGTGVAGAMLSNASQLLLARFLVFGEGMQFLIPPFLGAGLITGLILGLFCEVFCTKSRWYGRYAPQVGGQVAGQCADSAEPVPAAGEHPVQLREDRRERRRLLEQKRREGRRLLWDSLVADGDILAAGVFMGAAFLLNPSTETRTLQFLFFWFCSWASGKKNSPLITLLVIGGIVFVNLLAPYGRILAEIGPLRITQGSLIAGVRKGITLEGLIMLSRAIIRPGLQFPGSFGALMAESFRIFAGMSGQKNRITAKHFIEGIDALLLEADAGDNAAAPGAQPSQKRSAARPEGRILLCLWVLLTIGLTLAPLL
jgi:heptaprenyl diphosphate synthase